MTDRCVPPAVERLRPFLDAGVLGMAELQVVATFAAAAAPEVLDDDVLLAAAVAVRGPLHGDVPKRSQVNGVAVQHTQPAPCRYLDDYVHDATPARRMAASGASFTGDAILALPFAQSDSALIS